MMKKLELTSTNALYRSYVQYEKDEANYLLSGSLDPINPEELNPFCRLSGREEFEEFWEGLEPDERMEYEERWELGFACRIKSLQETRNVAVPARIRKNFEKMINRMRTLFEEDRP